MKKNECNDDTFVKIEFYKECYVEDVIYYIERMPFNLAYKYQWYFEYITALVKINHPHNRVILECGHQTLPTRDEYVANKMKSRLKFKKSQLERLKADPGFYDDFFGFDKKAREVKIERISQEIKALENGDITFYIPYVDGGQINKIKQYIK